MRNHKGQRTGGIYGVLNTILKETNKFNYFPVVVFDGHLSQRRLNIYPNYKKYQEKQMLHEIKEHSFDGFKTEMEMLQEEQQKEYHIQREILKELLPQFGIPVIHLPDWEGDDLIYILSRLTRDSIIVSDDKDLIQLFAEEDDLRCRIMRGMLDEFIDERWFQKEGITVDEFIIKKAIIGDPSDNILTACYNVGSKTASGLYKLYIESKDNFPKDEKSLSEWCKKLNLSNRKAYLNFDENQFLTNLLLIDLSLVENEITSELIEQIDDIIYEHSKDNDIYTINNYLDELEIRMFIPRNLLNAVDRNLNYIKVDYDTNFRAIKTCNDSNKNIINHSNDMKQLF